MDLKVEIDYSMSHLEQYTYRELQKLAKSLKLPSNYKKIYLVQLIHAKKYLTQDDVDNIIQMVKMERQWMDGGVKRKKGKRKPRVQKVQNKMSATIKTCLSPPTHSTPSPRSSHDTLPQPPKQSPIECPQNSSDRVLRSNYLKTYQKPNYALLDGEYVYGVVASRKTDDPNEPISIVRSLQPRNSERWPVKSLERGMLTSSNENHLLTRSEMPCSRSHQRQNCVHPKTTGENFPLTNYQVHTVGFRRADGKIAKINALVQNTSTVVQNTSVLVQNSSGLVQNNLELVQNTSGQIQNTSSVVQKRGLLQKRALVRNTSLQSVQNSSGLVQNNLELVQNTSGQIQNTSSVVQKRGLLQKRALVRNTSLQSVQNSSGLVQNTLELVQNTLGLVQNTSGLIQNTSAVVQQKELLQKRSLVQKTALNSVQNSSGLVQNTSGLIQNTLAVVQQKGLLKRALAQKTALTSVQNSSGLVQNTSGLIQNTSAVVQQKGLLKRALAQKTELTSVQNTALVQKTTVQNRAMVQKKSPVQKSQNVYKKKPIKPQTSLLNVEVTVQDIINSSINAKTNENPVSELVIAENRKKYPNMSTVTEELPNNTVTTTTQGKEIYTTGLYTTYQHKKNQAGELPSRVTGNAIPDCTEQRSLPRINEVFMKFERFDNDLKIPLGNDINNEPQSSAWRHASAINYTNQLETFYTLKREFLPHHEESLPIIPTTSGTYCVNTAPTNTTAVIQPSATQPEQLYQCAPYYYYNAFDEKVSQNYNDGKHLPSDDEAVSQIDSTQQQIDVNLLSQNYDDGKHLNSDDEAVSQIESTLRQIDVNPLSQNYDNGKHLPSDDEAESQIESTLRQIDVKPLSQNYDNGKHLPSDDEAVSQIESTLRQIDVNPLSQNYDNSKHLPSDDEAAVSQIERTLRQIDVNLASQNYCDGKHLPYTGNGCYCLPLDNQRVVTSATQSEMMDDALEYITQDENYWHRLNVDDSMSCILCSWAGPKFMLENHIRLEHADQIVKQNKNTWNTTTKLSSLVNQDVWLSHVAEFESMLYILSLKYEDPDCFMVSLTNLTCWLTSHRGKITIFNKVSGEPYYWEGPIQELPINMPYDNVEGLKIQLSKLELLPNSANLKLVNRELVPMSPSRTVVGKPELADIHIIVFVNIFNGAQVERDATF